MSWFIYFEGRFAIAVSGAKNKKHYNFQIFFPNVHIETNA